MIKFFLPIILMAFLIMPFFAYPQALDKKESIKVLANGKGDSIILRWAPLSPAIWQMGNKYGYNIERYVFSKNGKVTDNKEKLLLTPEPLKPWPKTATEKIIDNEGYAEAIAEILYSDDFSPQGPKENLLSILDIKNEQERRYGFTLLLTDFSTVAATVAGLRFVDKQVEKNCRYIYSIKVAQPVKNKTVYEPGVVIVGVSETFKKPIIQDLQIKFENKKSILSWPLFLYEGTYSGYIIERSSDEKNYIPITEQPYIQTSERQAVEQAYFVDSLSDNTTTFYYRIKGITPFAEVSEPSAIVSGKGKEQIIYNSTIDNATILNNKKILLNWHVENGQANAVKKVVVSRSAKTGGPYEDLVILDGNTINKWEDEKPGLNNYYRLKTIDKDSNIIFSLPYYAPLEDDNPPGIPIGLNGTVSKNGEVQLQWKNNPDNDLLGYRVFRSNNMSEEVVEITEKIATDTIFRDTINLHTLTKNIYYSIVAVDKRFNTSAYSSLLKLHRPDTIPPAPATFDKFEENGEGLSISFMGSISNDVEKYELYRQVGSYNVKLANFYDQDKLFFIDTITKLPDVPFFYEIMVTDSNGNRSLTKSKPIIVKNQAQVIISNIKYNADRISKKIILQWGPVHSAIEKYIIYKSRNNEPLVLYKIISGSNTLFEDNNLFINNAYKYQILPVFKNGIYALSSPVIKVQY